MRKYIASALLLISVLTGLTAFYLYNSGYGLEKQDTHSDNHDHSSHNHTHSHKTNSSREEFTVGSAHRHALFYTVVNGSEINFLESKYQLSERYVHLENNNSHVVHSHAKNVEWIDFLESINVSIEKGKELCITAKNVKKCGEGSVWLNGDRNVPLNRKIMQGDKLILAVGSNFNQTIDEYSKIQLPQIFEPEERRGRRL